MSRPIRVADGAAAPIPPTSQPTLAEMSTAGLRAFFNIAHDWQLSVDEQLVLLGSPGRSTFFKWKAAPDAARLSRDTLERLSHLLGIYKALQILLPQPDLADGWVKRPNSAPPFNGKRALDRMLAGNLSDLVAVRQYLDAMRGGWA
ncbi:MbcA/ParS/Xre antitoxin family protein [Mycetohabitans sp. B2]|uniref:MbcA/ParS/Xre antitoxin family protein n=1 Tax=Mycetohabitans sp. B2 TaxID=2841274 RepID=UPI001F3518AA|nr:MbcA/ParS/Xre antitoxin family protein [Mycetohabitans sp. B2]MCF7695595.1 MbcA/ParS/Xre antitoxin family protein [Mycetohabitans sp. B2]